jgi:hypothetical protein
LDPFSPQSAPQHRHGYALNTSRESAGTKAKSALSAIFTLPLNKADCNCTWGEKIHHLLLQRQRRGLLKKSSIDGKQYLDYL